MESPRRKIIIILAVYAILALAGAASLYSLLENSVKKSSDEELKISACAAAAALGDDFLDKACAQNSLQTEEQLDSITKISRFKCRSGNIKKISVIAENSGKLFFAASSATKDEIAKDAYIKHGFACEERQESVRAAMESANPVFDDIRGEDGKTYREANIPMKTKSGRSFAVRVEDRVATEDHTSAMALEAAGLALLLAILLPLALLPLVRLQGSGGSMSALLHERQAQLIHAGRLVAMGEMTAGIAHEINQPLCVIRGYLELLQAVLAKEPILKERQLDNAFDIGIKSVDKASKIINHMRSFVRLKGGEPKPISLKTPIEEGLNFFNEQIKLHNINLEMKFPSSLPEVKIDSQKFEQIVVDLVANARYAVDEKGEKLGREFKKRIELKLSHDEERGRVVFEVTDNGFGMSEEAVRKCGEPFFTTKKPGEGTGLGVSIVKQIASDYEGELNFKTVPGEGCSFSVSFPAYKLPDDVPQLPKLGSLAGK